jgi:hypothetical protein
VRRTCWWQFTNNQGFTQTLGGYNKIVRIRWARGSGRFSKWTPTGYHIKWYLSRYLRPALDSVVRAAVQPKSSILIGAKVEIHPTPKGFTLGVKAKLEKNSFNLPQA